MKLNKVENLQHYFKYSLNNEMKGLEAEKLFVAGFDKNGLFLEYAMYNGAFFNEMEIEIDVSILMELINTIKEENEEVKKFILIHNHPLSTMRFSDTDISSSML